MEHLLRLDYKKSCKDYRMYTKVLISVIIINICQFSR